MTPIQPEDNYLAYVATFAASVATTALVALSCRVAQSFSQAFRESFEDAVATSPPMESDLPADKTLSHSELLEELKKPGNPNRTINSQGDTPLHLLVRAEVDFPKAYLMHPLNAITAPLEALRRKAETDPSIAQAVQKATNSIEEGVHLQLPKELAEAADGLVKRGADPFKQNAKGETPFQIAMQCPERTLVPSLCLIFALSPGRKLTRADIDAHALTSTPKKNLQYLYTIAFINAIKAEEDINPFADLFSGENPLLNTNKSLYMGENLLKYAIDHNHTGAIQLLCDNGAEVVKSDLPMFDSQISKNNRNPNFSDGFSNLDSSIFDFIKYAQELGHDDAVVVLLKQVEDLDKYKTEKILEGKLEDHAEGSPEHSWILARVRENAPLLRAIFQEQVRRSPRMQSATFTLGLKQPDGKFFFHPPGDASAAAPPPSIEIPEEVMKSIGKFVAPPRPTRA
ncbi:MAG: hypothetical protein P0S96_02415 [Simkaniaceae bacterium]|nr:hypothetical protein [Candidatus Sacchlamyda saccharinae]